jgi:hypothetical protein
MPSRKRANALSRLPAGKAPAPRTIKAARASVAQQRPGPSWTTVLLELFRLRIYFRFSAMVKCAFRLGSVLPAQAFNSESSPLFA